MKDLLAQWQAYSARFATLLPREKYLVVGAVLVAILFAGYSLVIEPAQLRKATAQKLVAQYRSDLATLGPQADVLRAQLKDPDAPMRNGIADLRKQMADLNQKLSGFDKMLVAPDKMASLLQALMARHRGLDVLSLRTLPPQPVIQRAEDKQESKQENKQEAKPGAPKAAPTGEAANIYKHGLEIKLAGGYQDLLSYVSEIEQSPQRLLMGSMQLDATHYPRVELTLVVYSLSLDRTWLVV